MYRPSKVKRFDFPPGRIVAGKYEVGPQLGSGYEGEVYAIVERATGIASKRVNCSSRNRLVAVDTRLLLPI